MSLRSALEQDTMPFEIIIGDDSSTDNTFNILYNFQKEYPSIIKLFRHKKNLGVFKNIDFLRERVTGDIVTFLAGDDYFNPGLFTELNNIIWQNGINTKDDYYIVPNISILQLNGKSRIVNNYANRHLNPFKQRIRYSLICGAIGISTSLLKRISPYRTDIGYHADWLWSLELDFKCKMHYYTPFVAFTYRASVGVSQTTNKEVLDSSLREALTIIKKQFSNSLDRKDKLFLEFVEKLFRYRLNPDVVSYILLITGWVKNWNNYTKECDLITKYTFVPKSVIVFMVKIKSLIKNNYLLRLN